MKTRFLTLVTFLVTTTIMMNSCTFLKGTGSTSNNNSLCLNYENSEESQLEVGLVHEMTDIYQRRSNVNDAQAIRLDLETLKKFVYHLEMEAKNNNVPSQDLGIRIYYARYPKKSTWQDTFDRDLSGFLNDTITQQYEMLHTVVMIPTIKKGTNHYDFNPLDFDTYANGMISVPAYSPSSDNPFPTSLTFGLTVKPTPNAQNHGGLYPPYPDTGRNF